MNGETERRRDSDRYRYLHDTGRSEMRIDVGIDGIDKVMHIDMPQT